MIVSAPIFLLRLVRHVILSGLLAVATNANGLDEIQATLDQLAAQHDLAQVESLAPLRDLNLKFRKALKDRLDEAQEQGELKAVLASKEALVELENMQVTPESEDSEVASLKQIYLQLARSPETGEFAMLV